MDPRGIRDCHEQALEGREALKRREGDLSTLTARVRAPVVAIAAHDEGNFLLGVGLNELLDIKFLMLIAYLDSVNELGEYYLPGVIDAQAANIALRFAARRLLVADQDRVETNLPQDPRKLFLRKGPVVDVVVAWQSILIADDAGNLIDKLRPPVIKDSDDMHDDGFGAATLIGDAELNTGQHL